jgi:hypothetical protein
MYQFFLEIRYKNSLLKKSNIKRTTLIHHFELMPDVAFEKELEYLKINLRMKDDLKPAGE